MFSYLKPYDDMSEDESNRFTVKDIADALQAFEDKDLITYPINSIAKRSGFTIKKNRRNYEDESNRFTVKDIADALQAFEDKDLITYPINSIAKRSGFTIKKNRRNYRKQEQHLQIARFTRDLNYEDKNGWANKDGAPIKKDIVKEWQAENPNGTKKECKDDTGLTYPTIRKWWD